MIKINNKIIDVNIPWNSLTATPTDDQTSIDVLVAHIEQVDVTDGQLSVTIAVSATTSQVVMHYYDYDEDERVKLDVDQGPFPVVEDRFETKFKLNFPIDQLEKRLVNGHYTYHRDMGSWVHNDNIASEEPLDFSQRFSNRAGASHAIVDSFNHAAGTADEPLRLVGFGSGPEFDLEFTID